MLGLNKTMAADILKQLEALPPETKPVWGKMNVPQLLGHLRAVLRYTMGEGPNMPFRGNWFSRQVLRHLIVNQVVKMPKNVRLPRPTGLKELPPPPECTVEELEETFHAYFERYARGELGPRVHPYFGDLSAASWNKLHAAHFKHHLKQFGLK